MEGPKSVDNVLNRDLSQGSYLLYALLRSEQPQNHDSVDVYKEKSGYLVWYSESVRVGADE